MGTDSQQLGALEAQISPHYRFPVHRLRRQQRQPDREPLVLVSCGSFSPVTYLHLRMCVLAADCVRDMTKYEVIGIYMSPVSDAYRKKGLANARDRVRMCELATQTSDNIMVDSWEAQSSVYVNTATVLDHFHREINERLGGCGGKKVRIALLGGADLFESFTQPGVWSQSDLQHILGDYGVFVLERAGVNLDQALTHLQEWEHNIYVMTQLVPNEVSSTKIRLLLRRNMTIKYLTPDEVVDYIKERGLYLEDAPPDQDSAMTDNSGTYDVPVV